MRNFLSRRNNDLGFNFFDDAFEDFFKPTFFGVRETSMKTDVKETDKGFELAIDMPGYDKKDINVVAMHDSISYFAKDLGLNVIDIIQNNEEDTPTQKRITEIVDNMNKNNVKAILMENTYSDRLATLLANETGATIYYFDSITSGTGEKTEYIEKMQKNYDMIKELEK